MLMQIWKQKGFRIFKMLHFYLLFPSDIIAVKGLKSFIYFCDGCRVGWGSGWLDGEEVVVGGGGGGQRVWGGGRGVQ